MDIVERLRNAIDDPGVSLELDRLDTIMMEAADEIERLREALKFYAKEHFPASEGPWGIDSDDFGNVARSALKGDE